MDRGGWSIGRCGVSQFPPCSPAQIAGVDNDHDGDPKKFKHRKCKKRLSCVHGQLLSYDFGNFGDAQYKKVSMWLVDVAKTIWTVSSLPE